MDIKPDAALMYWSPAPPKWDISPARVKASLFPEYHGLEHTDQELDQDLDDDFDDYKLDEDLTFYEEDPEDAMMRER